MRRLTSARQSLLAPVRVLIIGGDGVAAIDAKLGDDAAQQRVVLSGSAAPADLTRRFLLPEVSAGPERENVGYPLWVLAFFSVLHVLISAALVTLILMHSGREAGFGGMGFTPTSQGGTHIVERNLTRLTVVVSVLFVTNTIILYRLLA